MASTKVRGITIELGADTSGLSKALTGVNSEIGKTQKALKDVPDVRQDKIDAVMAKMEKGDYNNVKSEDIATKIIGGIL